MIQSLSLPNNIGLVGCFPFLETKKWVQVLHEILSVLCFLDLIKSSFYLFKHEYGRAEKLGDVPSDIQVVDSYAKFLTFPDSWSVNSKTKYLPSEQMVLGQRKHITLQLYHQGNKSRQ